MTDTTHIAEASVLRLSRYHCFVGELLRSGFAGRLTSAHIAEELGVSEEAVRRDLSHIDVAGRPGAGYDPQALFDALGAFLDLSANHPFIVVGNRDILAGLTITFPAESFGMSPVAYFSERPEDVGSVVGGLQVRSTGEMPRVVPGLGASLALVACAPDAVQDTLTLLHESCIRGVLMMTPVLDVRHPEDMNVTYFRIPCTLKSLASSEASPSCCSAD